MTDAEVGDSELVFRLDLDGLHTLMRTLEAAEPGETTGAFGRVSVALVEAAAQDGGDALPQPAGVSAD